jgi:hypothetical protein
MAFLGGADAEKNYTRGVLQTSNDLLAHLYALRELAVRWPPGEDSGLSAVAKSLLVAIVRDHARSIQTSVSELKPQIDFLLKGFGYETITEIPGAGNGNWRDASASARDTARTTDRILRSLLTTSQTPMSVNEALPKLKESVQALDNRVHELLARVQ